MTESQLSIIGFLIVFPAMWLAMNFLISVLGGWFWLGREYPANREFTGTLHHRQHCNIGFWTSYSGCVNIGISSDGVFMQPMFLFRFAHPALFIPWSEMESATEKNYFWTKYYVIKTRKSNTKIYLPRKLFETHKGLLPLSQNS